MPNEREVSLHNFDYGLFIRIFMLFGAMRTM